MRCPIGYCCTLSKRGFSFGIVDVVGKRRFISLEDMLPSFLAYDKRAFRICIRVK
ncbi:hypothetical protein CORMATOL_00889 [Corynebacterium matruchotii ATCC 33806]|uniref:Uncharacterized protein n=1 Tax=Corynebacterium matruchotii ATCC 33806 TaxID=566549 RepID=C0E1N8_9CORY|nr:hypothetical protein CORMATOL_00889 [Corynebacterium matruchotii ATCC 33806]